MNEVKTARAVGLSASSGDLANGNFKFTDAERQLNSLDIEKLANIFNVNITNYPLKVLQEGFNIEWEHAKTVNGDQEIVFKIVLDHLREIPDYYDRLIMLEQKANKFWAKKKKPSLLISNKKNKSITIKDATRRVNS